MTSHDIDGDAIAIKGTGLVIKEIGPPCMKHPKFFHLTIMCAIYTYIPGSMVLFIPEIGLANQMMGGVASAWTFYHDWCTPAKQGWSKVRVLNTNKQRCACRSS